MPIIENSLIGGPLLRLCLLLVGWYETSAVAILLRGVTGAWTNWFRSSAIMNVLTREGTLPKAWRGSMACRLLGTALNLPAALLHWLYRTFQRVFDGSLFANLGFAIAEQVPAAIGWVMLGILSVPYKQWDNTYSLMGFAFVLVLFIAGGMRKRSQRLDVASVGPYAILFAGAVLLSWPLSVVSALSLRFLFFHITCMLCVVVTVSAVEKPEHLTRLCAFAGIATVGVSLVGVAQRLSGLEVNASYVDIMLNKGIPGRVFSVFDNPNAFAEVLVMIIPLSAALVLGSRTLRGRLFALVPLGLGVMALAMTYSRASWIGLVIAVGVFVFLWNRKLIPGLILVGLFILPILPDTIFNRILTIFNTSDTSTASRLPLYEGALNLLGERPIRGAGLGTDVVRSTMKDMNLYHGGAPFVHAHNTFLQIWLETGLLGITAFLATMIGGVKAAAKAIKRPNCPHSVRIITIGAACAIVGSLVNSLADYLWNYPRVMVIFWFVFAIMLSGIKLAKAAGHQK